MFKFPAFRVIPFEYFNGIENMSLDLFYADIVGIRKIPILRFYGWKPYCLSIGHHQDLKSVDNKKVIEDGIDLVRRPTGGSAILHANELTYSFIIPKTVLTHHEMYEIFHEQLAKTLNGMGIEVNLNRYQKDESYLNQDNTTFACFNRAAKSEIQYLGKKVVGSAQKIYQKSILQHGSIIIGDEQENIIHYLNSSKIEKNNQINILKNNSTNLEKITKSKISKNFIASSLVEAFADNYSAEIYYKYPTDYEKKEAEKFNKEVIVSNNTHR